MEMEMEKLDGKPILPVAGVEVTPININVHPILPSTDDRRSSVKTRRSSVTPAPPTFPEGGLAAWMSIVGAALILFCVFGNLQSFGVYQDYYTRTYLAGNSTPSQVSWIGSIQIFLLFALALPCGRIFDNGYFRALMIVGTLLYVFAMMMLSLAQSHEYYQIVLSQGVATGIGMGILFIPALSIPSHYFRARRSTATGVAFGLSSLGSIIYPIMLNKLFAGHAGFGWGVRAVAFSGLGLLIIANLIMRTRLPSRKQRPNAFQPSFKRIFTDVPFMVCAAGAFLVFWGLFFPFFYIQLFANSHGVSSTLTLYTLAIMNGASLFGRSLPNFAADRYGVFNVIIPVTGVAGALIFAMLGATSDAGVIAFSIFYGFFSGGFLSLVAPMAASFSTDVGEVGSRIGVLLFIASFALLTGTPISGALLGSPPNYTWRGPIIFNAVSVLAGTAGLVVSRTLAAKRRGTQKL